MRGLRRKRSGDAASSGPPASTPYNGSGAAAAAYAHRPLAERFPVGAVDRRARDAQSEAAAALACSAGCYDVMCPRQPERCDGFTRFEYLWRRNRDGSRQRVVCPVAECSRRDTRHMDSTDPVIVASGSHEGMWRRVWRRTAQGARQFVHACRAVIARKDVAREGFAAGKHRGPAPRRRMRRQRHAGIPKSPLSGSSQNAHSP